VRAAGERVRERAGRTRDGRIDELRVELAASLVAEAHLGEFACVSEGSAVRRGRVRVGATHQGHSSRPARRHWSSASSLLDGIEGGTRAHQDVGALDELSQDLLALLLLEVEPDAPLAPVDLLQFIVSSLEDRSKTENETAHLEEVGRLGRERVPVVDAQSRPAVQRR